MSLSGDRMSHHAIVTSALQRLGRPHDATSVEFHLVTGGASGSDVYRVILAEGEGVLKITLPASGATNLARAHREARFYRELAHRVPIRVPRMIALDVDEIEGTTVLLAAYHPVPSPASWSEAMFLAVAADLGRFHAAFWDRTRDLGDLGWIPQPRLLVVEEQCLHAAETWPTLGEDLVTSGITTEGRLRAVLQTLDKLPELDRMQPPFPWTLCHGDCHAGNLLQEPAGERIWADWQEIRIGHGSDDLSFLCQRALAAGARVPYASLSRAYHAILAETTTRPPSLPEIVAALTWSEVRSWLIDWPPYLGYLSPANAAGVVARIDFLLDGLKS